MNKNKINLVLSGGGIKGIAYAGVTEEILNRGYIIENIAGTSAGAIAAAFIGAGYKSLELRKIMQDFDFEKVEISEISKRVFAVKECMDFYNVHSYFREKNYKTFLGIQSKNNLITDENFELDVRGIYGNILKNIVKYSKNGCLYDGDYLENWIRKMLLNKGIRTFGDFKKGIVDKENPRGYKVRMTATDVNRGRVIVLPDDISFYGIEPDNLEVSKAIRMSISVP